MCAARNRATAGEHERGLLRAFGPLLGLAHAGFDGLVPVEAGVLDEQRVTERGDELGARAARVQEAVGLVARVVDAALDLEALGEGVEITLLRAREPCRGDVEEAVEVDAERGVDAAAQQLRRRVAARARGASAFALVNEWWTVFQSPWSFWMWKRVMRSAAA